MAERSARLAACSRSGTGSDPRNDSWNDARLAGFEPATGGLEIRCSIQLSYRRKRADQFEMLRSGRSISVGRNRWEDDGDRTHDSWNHNPVLYRLSYILHRSGEVVGVRGFEPPAPCSQSRCATGLRHTPFAVGIVGQRRKGCQLQWIPAVPPPVRDGARQFGRQCSEGLT